VTSSPTLTVRDLQGLASDMTRGLDVPFRNIRFDPETLRTSSDPMENQKYSNATGLRSVEAVDNASQYWLRDVLAKIKNQKIKRQLSGQVWSLDRRGEGTRQLPANIGVRT
jgi:hypothetical protein